MKKLLIDGWKFWQTEYGTTYETALEHISEFKPVTIPHDYLIYDTSNLYKDSTGWYTKEFELGAADIDGTIFLVFDGIYMDSIVYVNGRVAGEWKYGYSQFVLEITDLVKEGTNTLFVAARCKFPNTRWYSGAGIYRNVYLIKNAKTYIPENGVYVHSERCDNGYEILVNTEVCGKGIIDSFNLKYELCDTDGNTIELRELPDGGKPVFEDRENTTFVQKRFAVSGVKEWSVDEPNLYEFRAILTLNHEDIKDKNELQGIDNNRNVVQEVTTRIGFRDVRMDPDKGFFLNDINMKLNGVCLHHDLGALGSAYDSTAMRRRLIQLKEMGVNAIRMTHNMYDPDVIRLADEMGFLLISEAFDMWEGAKTEFDYARFFPEWHGRDVASWVRRDRNHPSVIMWSIGNEIYDTHASERGQEVTRDLKSLVELHDPLMNARATIGSNYMPWEMAQKCADILKVAGYNYAENYYEDHHSKHPDWIIYGSETYSIVQSRGVYHFPLAVPTLSESDQQCSSLGNSTTSWGADSIEACICKDRDMEFSMGQFVWTGYDYIGEPTPYQTKNSYFGLIDTAGFYKDAFYAFKSAWVSAEKDPFVHVFPYWDFNDGQLIDVRVCSNAPEVELFLNGKSLGRQNLTHEPHSGYKIFADYSVPYEAGELKAVAYDAEGKEIATDIHRSFGDTDRFVVDIDHRVDDYIESNYKNLNRLSDGAGEKEPDLMFAEISAIDKDGNPVENASDYVNVTVTGDGKLVGLDNGDSTDYDSYQSSCRKLFNGKLLAIVKVTGDKDTVKVNVEKAENVPVRTVKLSVKGVDINNSCEEISTEEGTKLRLLTPERKTACVTATVYPADATNPEVTFRALNKNGTDTNLASIVQDGNTCIVTALGDGEFVIRAEAKSGRDVVAVISSLEFKVEGLGKASLDPYGFISGSLYSSYIGKIGNGNEHGVASAKDGETIVTYTGVDFGKDYSDEITIPIFTLNDDEYRFEIWKGIPGEDGAKLIKEAVYQKKSIWNTYQPETYKLNTRLTGLQTISLRLFNKYHIKGFSFNRQLRAFSDTLAIDAESIYGDTFTRTEDAVEGIGNNVTLDFGNYDFGEDGATKISIFGRAHDKVNTIHVIFKNDEEEFREILEFNPSDEYREIIFDLKKASDKTKKLLSDSKAETWNISFVFLPGSNFDFKSFCFQP